MNWILLLFTLTTIDQVRLPPENLTFRTQDQCEQMAKFVSERFAVYARSRGYNVTLLALCVPVSV